MVEDTTNNDPPFTPGLHDQVDDEVVPSLLENVPSEPESPTLTDVGKTKVDVGISVTPLLDTDL
jgi:hypothetical protein